MTWGAPRGIPLASALATSCAIGAVRTYQWTVRPMIGPNCRFWPTCSDYAIEAFRQHGALRGSAMAARRILRCNPWHPGGVDPVPPRDPAPPAPRLDAPPVGRRDAAIEAPCRIGSETPGRRRRMGPSMVGPSMMGPKHGGTKYGGTNSVTAYREQARGPIGSTPTRDRPARRSQMGH